MLFFCLASISCTKADTKPAENSGSTAKGVTAYITSTDLTYAFSKKEIPFLKADFASDETITLTKEQRFQTMYGFGAAVTGSSCYNLLKMAPADRENFLKMTFSPTDGLGYSYIRIAIGGSDFSLSEYTCCDAKGIENFALTAEEKDYVIPVLKEILKINPKVKILGSPWTCPRWMKVNNLTDLLSFNSWTSGQLNPIYYQDYATYFVKWIQAFIAEGIEITAVTPQNEPLNRKNSVSLYMGWEEQRDFVNAALVPKLKSAGLKTKIYLYDHNYDYSNLPAQNDYPANIYDCGTEGDYVVGAAYHNYGGNRSELLDIRERYSGKGLIFTETSIGTWNDGHNLEVRLLEDMQNVALGTVNNWCQAVIVWNLMLDANRGPNRPGGCTTCYGAVDIGSDYKTMTRNSHYYIIGHMSAVVKPEAVRIGTSGTSIPGIVYSAFQNLDGSFALVLLNSNSEMKSITVADGNNKFKYSVPAKSVVSFTW